MGPDAAHGTFNEGSGNDSPRSYSNTCTCSATVVMGGNKQASFVEAYEKLEASLLPTDLS